MSTSRSQERVREVWTGRAAEDLSSEQLRQARVAGYEPGGGDYLIGRDPREMQQYELLALGHQRVSPTQAVRAKCLDCAGTAHEVRCCVCVACPLWPFRLGRSPWRAPISEERREALRERGFAPSKPHKIERSPSLVESWTGEAPAASER